MIPALLMRFSLPSGSPRSWPLLPARALALAGVLLLAGSPPIGPRPALAMAADQAEQPGNGLSVEEARAAANRILKAVQSRDPNLRFAQFSEELKAISSPEMVAETMRSQPKLLSWTLLSVRGGLSSTTVEASLKTSDGVRDLFMVLNPKGELTGYHFDLTDAKASLVAADFVRSLSRGHFISARSFLSLPLQEELTSATLQARWLQLQRSTGNFVRVIRVIEASQSEDSQLVLVNTEFNRLTDNLYVILNSNNEITGVDFPRDPNPPRKAPAPAR